MKAVGLIVEYNPFHNGHFYHLKASREKADADVVVCVMSGYFLQRGEPALMPRRARTKMALACGADLVVELPYIFSSQHAGWFAKGAVSVLDQLDVDTISFGSEQGRIEPFLQLLTFLQLRQDEYGRYLRAYSKQGFSFPKAAALAFQQLAPDGELPDLSRPNNILGFHYIQAIHELGSSIQPETVERMESDYHDEQLSETTISSATSIRRSLTKEKQGLDAIEESVPLPVYQQMQQHLHTGSVFHEWEQYFPYLQAKALTMPSSVLSDLYEAEEGIHHRFQAFIKTTTSFQTFMEALKTKRYTWTRLQRFAVQLLTGTSKTEAGQALETGSADHIRILGMNAQGQSYLNKVKKHVELPMFSTLPKHKTPQQKLDEKAAMAYYLPLSPAEKTKKWREEYEKPPLRIDV